MWGLGTFHRYVPNGSRIMRCTKRSLKVSPETASAVNRARREVKASSRSGNDECPYSGVRIHRWRSKGRQHATRLFIYPGYTFNVVDSLFTTSIPGLRPHPPCSAFAWYGKHPYSISRGNTQPVQVLFVWRCNAHTKTIDRQIQ